MVSAGGLAYGADEPSAPAASGTPAPPFLPKQKPSRQGWVSGQFCRKISRRNLVDVAGLRSFLALDDFELNVITLLEALVSFRGDSAVVHKYIGSIVTPDEAKPFGVVKPFDFAFNPGHLRLPPYIAHGAITRSPL
jgi:hypothetical protein